MIREIGRLRLGADIVIAALCVALRSALGYGSAIEIVVVLAMAGALAIRRLSPALALGVAWLGALVQVIALLPPDLSNAAILAVLFATARYGEPILRWLGLASAGLGSIVAGSYLASGGFAFPLGEQSIEVGIARIPQVVGTAIVAIVAVFAVLGLSWTLGLLARTWSSALQARRAQAEAERAVVLEQERNRIARDMHDVVAHSLAVVIAQADGARYASSAGLGATDAALATIASTAREALADVRLLLGQLRHSQGELPQPALTDLDALVAAMRRAGLDVALERTGDIARASASRQLAVYRIAQEALTNCLRHGDTTRPVRMRLDSRGDELNLTVENARTSAAQGEPVAGHGLTGMGERALLAGGTFTAGVHGELFVVSASVPIGSGGGE